MEAPPKLTPGQMATGEYLARLKMAWLAFFLVFGLFTAGFVCFLVMAFKNSNWGANTILGGIDGVLVWLVRHMVIYLFPHRTPTA
jgi:hypothetical protein